MVGAAPGQEQQSGKARSGGLALYSMVVGKTEAKEDQGRERNPSRPHPG